MLLNSIICLWVQQCNQHYSHDKQKEMSGKENEASDPSVVVELLYQEHLRNFLFVQ